MIRQATIADASMVHAVLLAAKDEIPLAATFGDQAHRKWVRDQCRRRNAWIAERNGVVAGVLIMQAGEIYLLVVAQAFRRQGIGRALAELALDNVRTRRYGGLTARVRATNVPIIALLSSVGFQPHPVLEAARPGWLVYASGQSRAYTSPNQGRWSGLGAASRV